MKRRPASWLVRRKVMYSWISRRVQKRGVSPIRREIDKNGEVEAPDGSKRKNPTSKIVTGTSIHFQRAKGIGCLSMIRGSRYRIAPTQRTGGSNRRASEMFE